MNCRRGMRGNGINAQIECTMYMCTVTHTWSQIRRKTDNNPKTSSNHSKTMLPFTKQHPYSVCGSSCCWAGSWSGTGHGRRQRGGWRETVMGGVFACAFLRQKSWLQKESKSSHCQDSLKTLTPSAHSYGKMCLCTC